MTQNVVETAAAFAGFGRLQTRVAQGQWKRSTAACETSYDVNVM